MRLALIEVPYDCGRFAERMGQGPRVLAERLPGRLAAAGHDAEIRPVRLPDGFHAEVAAVQALQPAVMEAVASARRDGRLPVVLSGNCGYAALGAAAALGPRAGVLWLDAHADFNTPETSPSGFFDGTSLATLVGRCWRGVAGALAGALPVAEERVLLVGARDLDPEERRMLEGSQVGWLAPEALRGDPGRLDRALDALAASASELYVHLDLDVLDPAELRANRYAVGGGLGVEEVVSLIASARRRMRIEAVALTAWDPSHDDEQRGVEAAARLVAALA